MRTRSIPRILAVFLILGLILPGPLPAAAEPARAALRVPQPRNAPAVSTGLEESLRAGLEELHWDVIEDAGAREDVEDTLQEMIRRMGRPAQDLPQLVKWLARQTTLDLGAGEEHELVQWFQANGDGEAYALDPALPKEAVARDPQHLLTLRYQDSWPFFLHGKVRFLICLSSMTQDNPTLYPRLWSVDPRQDYKKIADNIGRVIALENGLAVFTVGQAGNADFLEALRTRGLYVEKYSAGTLFVTRQPLDRVLRAMAKEIAAAGLEEFASERSQTSALLRGRFAQAKLTPDEFVNDVLGLPFRDPPQPPAGLVSPGALYSPEGLPMEEGAAGIIRKMAEDLAARSTLDEAVRAKALAAVDALLGRLDGEVFPSRKMRGFSDNQVVEMMLELVRVATGVADPYAQTGVDPAFTTKRQMNEAALRHLDAMQAAVSAQGDFPGRVRTAVALGIIGNALDFADVEQRKRLEDKGFDAQAKIQRAPRLTLRVDLRDEFVAALERDPAGPALFLVDNAGEIVFDLPLFWLLLEQGREVVVAGKTLPHANDMIDGDLREFFADSRVREYLGLAAVDARLRVIASGTRMTGCDLRRATPEFARAWRGADIIYAKGQGMIETLRYAPLSREVFHAVLVKAPRYFKEKDPTGGEPLSLAAGDGLFLRTPAQRLVNLTLSSQELFRRREALLKSFLRPDTDVSPDVRHRERAEALAQLMEEIAAAHLRWGTSKPQNRSYDRALRGQTVSRFLRWIGDDPARRQVEETLRRMAREGAPAIPAARRELEWMLAMVQGTTVPAYAASVERLSSLIAAAGLEETVPLEQLLEGWHPLSPFLLREEAIELRKIQMRRPLLREGAENLDADPLRRIIEGLRERKETYEKGTVTVETVPAMPRAIITYARKFPGNEISSIPGISKRDVAAFARQFCDGLGRVPADRREQLRVRLYQSSENTHFGLIGLDFGDKKRVTRAFRDIEALVASLGSSTWRPASSKEKADGKETARKTREEKQKEAAREKWHQASLDLLDQMIRRAPMKKRQPVGSGTHVLVVDRRAVPGDAGKLAPQVTLGAVRSRVERLHFGLTLELPKPEPESGYRLSGNLPADKVRLWIVPLEHRAGGSHDSLAYVQEKISKLKAFGKIAAKMPLFPAGLEETVSLEALLEGRHPLSDFLTMEEAVDLRKTLRPSTLPGMGRADQGQGLQRRVLDGLRRRKETYEGGVVTVETVPRMVRVIILYSQRRRGRELHAIPGISKGDVAAFAREFCDGSGRVSADQREKLRTRLQSSESVHFGLIGLDFVDGKRVAQAFRDIETLVASLGPSLRRVVGGKERAGAKQVARKEREGEQTEIAREKWHQASLDLLDQMIRRAPKGKEQPVGSGTHVWVLDQGPTTLNGPRKLSKGITLGDLRSRVEQSHLGLAGELPKPPPESGDRPFGSMPGDTVRLRVVPLQMPESSGMDYTPEQISGRISKLKAFGKIAAKMPLFPAGLEEQADGDEAEDIPLEFSYFNDSRIDELLAIQERVIQRAEREGRPLSFNPWGRYRLGRLPFSRDVGIIAEIPAGESGKAATAVGFVVYEPVMVMEGPELVAVELRVLHMGVDPRFGRRGIGKRLIQRIIENGRKNFGERYGVPVRAIVDPIPAGSDAWDLFEYLEFRDMGLSDVEGAGPLDHRLEEFPAWTPPRTQTGLEEGVGYVAVGGVGLLLPAELPASRYYVVAAGLEQAAAFIQAGRAPARIIAVAGGLEEAAAFVELGVPGDQVVRAWEWPTREEARGYAVRLARDWLAALEGVKVVVLEASARTVQGILAQLQEMLPSGWQAARPVTLEDVQQVLELSV